MSIGESQPFGRKLNFKKTPKNGLYLATKIGITSLWEELNDKLLTPGQLLGCLLLPWGITVQTGYREGLWHQK